RLRNWTVKPAPEGALPRLKVGQLVIAELQPPLEAPRAGEKPPTLTLRLRDDLPRAGRHPLPGAVPVEAAQVEGGLGIDCDGGLTVVVPGANEKPPRETALPPDELPDAGPWGAHLPRCFLAWRGQPPQGTLALRPRPVRLRAHSHNDVVVGPGGVAVSARSR